MVELIKHNIKDLILHFDDERKDGFRRMDLFPRLLAIENYYGKNNYGWELYLKMMKIIERHKYIKEKQKQNFIGLIKKTEDRTFNIQKYPLLYLKGTWHMADGAHRMSCILYNVLYRNDDGTVFVLKKSGIKDHEWNGIEWFIRYNFSEKEKKWITDKQQEVVKFFRNRL